MNKLERVEYWDCMRGLAMFLVVFCHACYFCMGCKNNLFALDLANALMLPLFFFISGRFSPIEMSWQSLGRRTLSLFCPTAIMFLLYEGVRMHGYAHLIDSLQDQYKAGYWFPVALLLMNLIHTLISCIFCKRGNFIPFVLAVSVVLIYALEQYDWNYNGAFLSRWISLKLIATFFPFYVLGVLYNKFSATLDLYIHNQWTAGLSLLLFVGMLFLPDLGFRGGIIRSFWGVLFAFIFFASNQELFSSKTLLGRQLSMIGRFTLPIYLIHYFFILGMKMPWVGAYLTSDNQIVFSVIGALIAIVLIYLSLGVRYIISTSAPLYKVLLGK